MMAPSYSRMVKVNYGSDPSGRSAADRSAETFMFGRHSVVMLEPSRV